MNSEIDVKDVVGVFRGKNKNEPVRKHKQHTTRNCPPGDFVRIPVLKRNHVKQCSNSEEASEIHCFYRIKRPGLSKQQEGVETSGNNRQSIKKVKERQDHFDFRFAFEKRENGGKEQQNRQTESNESNNGMKVHPESPLRNRKRINIRAVAAPMIKK